MKPVNTLISTGIYPIRDKLIKLVYFRINRDGYNQVNAELYWVINAQMFNFFHQTLPVHETSNSTNG